MKARKRIKHWLSERVSFHLYRGPGLTEAKLRLGTTHFRLSRWKYKSGTAEWRYRRFRAAISKELVSTESWLALLSRVEKEAA